MAASKKNINKPTPPKTTQNFPIVGIGASAGGLDAFKRLLTAIPEISGMAYVLVQHLDPTHESILPEILQRVTKIPVLEITDDIPLAPDHIYVIPSNKMLISTDGILKLTDREKKINLAIDIFFTSLAEVHKELAVGVVLSGTGSDGAVGLKAIKEYGGICIAQDAESAAYDGMPQSALNTGIVDFVLEPENIPAQLLLINSAYETSHVFREEETLAKDDEAVFKQILLLLRQRSGVDFTYYKQPTFHRRIARRIAIVKKENLADYLKFLRANKAEQDALFFDVLIPVTSFFRDPKTFHALTQTVFPTILKNKVLDEPIRIWIAGCSTGEEAFSIAICLHEYLSLNLSKGEGTKIQIFASDISEKAIKKARTAIYTRADVEKLSENQLNNYFVKNNEGYEVRKLIRDMCVFAPHNFLKDPPFAKMDLVSCRNVLIYMDTFLQKKAFATFNYALKENGFLLLGKSETTGVSSDLFLQVLKNEKIYSRKSLPGRFMHVATDRREEALTMRDKTASKVEGNYSDYIKSAETVMILKSPAGVVVNEQLDIVHIHGDITAFLQAPQGKPTHNLIKMAREGLAFELRNTIHKAKKEQAAVTKENIIMKENDNQSLVAIEIIPLTDTIEVHYLIRFEKKTITPELVEKKSTSGKINAIQKQNVLLEKELSQTREDMRYITEDMEASNEELQSANEEMQSSNEEMQSLNEELETSKEELQSTNEELTIVNQELQDKQEQLNAAHYYAESIISTTREPLIVLDRSLRIKTANASFYKKFKTEEQDIEGKLFYEIQNYQWDDTLMRTLLEKILPQKERLVDFEINFNFPLLGERNLLMNALQIVNEKNAEQLILLAIEDITERKAAEHKLENTRIELAEKNNLIAASEKRFSNIISQSLLAIAILKGPEMIVTSANETIIAIWGKGDNVIGKPLIEVLPEIIGQGFPELLMEVYNTGIHFVTNEIKCILFRNGKSEECYFNLIYQPYRDVDESITGITLLATETTEYVLAKKQIEENEKEQKKLASHLKLATDSAIIGIWSYDLISSQLEWSNIHKKMWGYSEDLENLTFQDWHIAVLAEDKAATFLKIEEAKINHTIYEADYRITRANDGAVVWIKSTGQFRYDALGVAHTLTGVSIDISEQKMFEEKLENKVEERTHELALKTKQLTEMNQSLEVKNIELENINEELKSFTHIASHDLQEPLRKIQAFSKRIIETEKFTEKTQDYFNRIISASERMQNLIVSLLAFSTTDRAELEVVSCDLNEIVAESKIDLHLTIVEKKAIVEYGKLPIVNGLRVQLSQLFINLIDNAIKYSQVGIVPHINITASIVEGKEVKHASANVQLYYNVIKITDNGIGFENEYANKIFDLFQRLHHKNKYSGTGIGLAIVKKIVTNHYGFITAEGKPNEGAIFTIYLPI